MGQHQVVVAAVVEGEPGLDRHRNQRRQRNRDLQPYHAVLGTPGIERLAQVAGEPGRVGLQTSGIDDDPAEWVFTAGKYGHLQTGKVWMLECRPRPVRSGREPPGFPERFTAGPSVAGAPPGAVPGRRIGARERWPARLRAGLVNDASEPGALAGEPPGSGAAVDVASGTRPCQLELGGPERPLPCRYGHGSPPSLPCGCGRGRRPPCGALREP